MQLQPYKVAVTEKSICTVSIGKINYRRLLKQMQLMNEVLQTRNLYQCICHEMRNGLLGNLFPVLLFITIKSKSMKEDQSRATILMSRELMGITYNFFGALRLNKDFPTPLAQANKLIPRIYPLASFFT